jgi:archaeosine-15-forming tRNA-guanine transglycosylase
MPDRDVKTIRHLIYYQYSKIIGKSAFGADSKSKDYGFIKNTFRDLVMSEKKSPPGKTTIVEKTSSDIKTTPPPKK